MFKTPINVKFCLGNGKNQHLEKCVLYLNHIFADKMLQKIGQNLHYPAIAKRLYEHEF